MSCEGEIHPSIGGIGGDAFYDFDGLAGTESPSGNPPEEAISVIPVKVQDPGGAVPQAVVIVRVSDFAFPEPPPTAGHALWRQPVQRAGK